VNRHLILDLHLVELIDAANTIVSKHQSTRLNTHVSILITSHTGSETSSTGCLSVCVDTPWHEFVDAFEELGLSRGGVSDDENVDVSSDVDFVLSALVYSTDELQEKSLFYFLVAVDGGEERFSHVAILFLVSLDLLDLLDLGLGQLGDDVVVYCVLIKVWLWIILAALHFFLLLIELVKLVVFHLDVDGHEDQLIAEVPHAFNAAHSSLSVRNTASLVASCCQLSLLSGLEHARQFWQDTQVADDLANVSGLAPFSEFVAENHINRARHGSGRYFGGVFLHSNLLEICESALGHLQLPTAPVAILSRASLGLSVLELLHDRLAQLSACATLKVADFELGPHF